jgi:hypothetical protein
MNFLLTSHNDDEITTPAFNGIQEQHFDCKSINSLKENIYTT